MLERITNFLKGQTLQYESRKVKVIETDTEYKFEPQNINRTRSQLIPTLQVDSNELTIDESLTLSKEEYSDSVITLYSGSSAKYAVNEKNSDTVLCLYVSDEQMQELETIELRGVNRDYLFESDSYTYDVTKMDDFWCISISGFIANTTVDTTIHFNNYPNVKLKDISVSESVQNADIRVQKKLLSCVYPHTFTGEIEIKAHKSRGKIPLEDLPNTASVSSLVDNKIYTTVEEVDDDIVEWENTNTVEIIIKPDTYVNMKKTRDLSVDNTVVFELDEFDKLGTVRVTYPEYISYSPYISVWSSDYDSDLTSDYIRPTKKEDNTVIFEESVIPSDELRVFHNNGLTKFEDRALRFSISSGEEKEFELEPTQKRATINIENDLEAYDNVVVSINSDQKTVSYSNSVELDIKCNEDNLLTLEKLDGSDILSVEDMDREELLRLTKPNLKLSEINEVV